MMCDFFLYPRVDNVRLSFVMCALYVELFLEAAELSYICVTRLIGGRTVWARGHPHPHLSRSVIPLQLRIQICAHVFS